MTKDRKKAYEEAINALKDAQKALEKCNVFTNHNYDWLKHKINKVLWAAKRAEKSNDVCLGLYGGHHPYLP